MADVATSQSPLTAAQIAAQLLAVDQITMNAVRCYSGNVNRPVGLRVVGAMSVQDANVALGIGALQNTTLAQYTLGR